MLMAGRAESICKIHAYFEVLTPNLSKSFSFIYKKKRSLDKGSCILIFAEG